MEMLEDMLKAKIVDSEFTKEYYETVEGEQIQVTAELY